MNRHATLRGPVPVYLCTAPSAAVARTLTAYVVVLQVSPLRWRGEAFLAGHAYGRTGICRTPTGCIAAATRIAQREYARIHRGAA